MKNLKTFGIVLGLVSSMTFASAPCTGFDIKLQNNLDENLQISSIKLQGAELNPTDFKQLNAKTDQIFTVNNSLDNVPMTGEFVLHTLSLPAKEVRIQYTLENSGLVCEHKDQSIDGNFSLDKTRLVGQVQYSINNK